MLTRPKYKYSEDAKSESAEEADDGSHRPGRQCRTASVRCRCGFTCQDRRLGQRGRTSAEVESDEQAAVGLPEAVVGHAGAAGRHRAGDDRDSEARAARGGLLQRAAREPGLREPVPVLDPTDDAPR